MSECHCKVCADLEERHRKEALERLGEEFRKALSSKNDMIKK